MPATTSSLSIPYPLPDDKVSAYPTTAKQAAEIIESTCNGGQMTENQASAKNIGVPKGATILSNPVSITTTGGVVLVTCHGRLSTDGPATGYIRAAVGGAKQALGEIRLNLPSTVNLPYQAVIPIVLPAGTYSMAVAVTVDDGSMNAIYLHDCRIQAVEIR